MAAKLATTTLVSLLLLGGTHTCARAQGWDYGRQMFGFAQYRQSTGWSSYYHPGDGRQGVFYVDAGQGNYFGDPKARPLAPYGPGSVHPRRDHRLHRRWQIGRRP